MKRRATPEPCPCGGGTYADCCGPLHAGAPAVDAQALMRSRYAAYVRGDVDYLLASWHPSTRPPRATLQQPGPTWLGLEIRRHTALDAEHAEVEFIARYRIGGGRAERLHEVSRFVREAGRWVYVDGDVAAGGGAPG